MLFFQSIYYQSFWACISFSVFDFLPWTVGSDSSLQCIDWRSHWGGQSVSSRKGRYWTSAQGTVTVSGKDWISTCVALVCSSCLHTVMPVHCFCVFFGTGDPTSFYIFGGSICLYLVVCFLLYYSFELLSGTCKQISNNRNFCHVSQAWSKGGFSPNKNKFLARLILVATSFTVCKYLPHAGNINIIVQWNKMLLIHTPFKHTKRYSTEWGIDGCGFTSSALMCSKLCHTTVY